MVEYQDDLNKLELLSVEISDLVNTNNFEKILKLDLERQKIINKISNTVLLTSKNKITEIVNINNTSINRIEDKRYLNKREYIQPDGTFSLKNYSYYKLHKELDSIRQEMLFLHKQHKESLKIKANSFDFLMKIALKQKIFSL